MKTTINLIQDKETAIKALYSGATIIQDEINYPEKECPEIYALVNNANLMALGIGKTIAAQTWMVDVLKRINNHP